MQQQSDAAILGKHGRNEKNEKNEHHVQNN